MLNNFFKGYRKILHFHGRASRKAYWHFMFISILLSQFVFQIIRLYVKLTKNDKSLKPEQYIAIDQAIVVLYNVIAFFVLLSVFSYTARRMHDVGRSAWWLLVWVFGLIFRDAFPITCFSISPSLLYFCAKKGTPGVNKYGPEPKRNKKASR